MKSFYLFFSVFFLSGVFCGDENKEPFHYTTTKNRTCVKVYYTQDDYYKTYCFNYLSNYNDSLGIVTEKNDTIIYSGYGNTSECFDVYKSNAKNKTLVCINVTSENCLDDKKEVKLQRSDDIHRIPCKLNTDLNYLGIRFDDLTVLFRCVLYSVKVSVKKDDIIFVRYCFNRRIVGNKPRAGNNTEIL